MSKSVTKGEGVLQVSTSHPARWTDSAKTGCSVVLVESLQVLHHRAPSVLWIRESLWIVWPVGTPKSDQGQSVTAAGSRFCCYPFPFTSDAAVLAQDSGKLRGCPAGLGHPRPGPGGCVSTGSCADSEEGQAAKSRSLPGSHWRSHRHLWVTMWSWKPSRAWSCSTHPQSSRPHGSLLS